MTLPAILMMVFSMVVLWGGLAVASVLLVKHNRTMQKGAE